MKTKIMTAMMALGVMSLAQAGTVLINCYSATGNSADPAINNFDASGGTAGNNSRSISNLKESDGTGSSYGLTVNKTAGNYFNQALAAFTNSAAIADMTTTLGISSFDTSLLTNSIGPGAGGSRTDTLTLNGLGGTVDNPLEVTLYMWFGSNPTDGVSFTGIGSSVVDGTFSYATNGTSGFVDTYSAPARGNVIGVKWTGVITSDTLTFTLAGGAKTGPSMVAFSVNPVAVPEPATFSLGLIGLSSLLIRRRRS